METEEYWKKYVDLWNSESDRFWVRSNIYLIVNGGLLAVTTGLSKIPLFSLIVSLFGVIFAIIWHQTNRISKHYVARWKVLIGECEEEMNDKHGFTGRLSELKKTSDKYKDLNASTTHMLIIIKLLIMIWCLFSILFCFQIYKDGAFGDKKQNNKIEHHYIFINDNYDFFSYKTFDEKRKGANLANSADAKSRAAD